MSASLLAGFAVLRNGGLKDVVQCWRTRLGLTVPPSPSAPDSHPTTLMGPQSIRADTNDIKRWGLDERIDSSKTRQKRYR